MTDSVGPQQHAAFTVDVSSGAAITDLMGNIKQTFSGVPSIAVNCAGITRDNFLTKLDEEAFDEVIAVNLKVCFGSYVTINYRMAKS